LRYQHIFMEQNGLLIAESSVQERSQGAAPPIEMMFQDFRFNFSWDMPKMHYFSNKFWKIAKRWGLSAPTAP